jgi:DNA-binding transcriptional regulator YiaG
MGIATVLVRSWESGASQPDSKQLQDLAKTFGVDEASIRNWEKNTYQPTNRYMTSIIKWLTFDPRSP